MWRQGRLILPPHRNKRFAQADQVASGYSTNFFKIYCIMGMIYLVRKKVFQTKEGLKELYYAVQRTLQARGGVTNEKLARRMSQRKGMTEGDVLSVLSDLPVFIEKALREGESVTIRGLGTFNLAITSPGCECPDDVMPGKVEVSRVYFKPDRGLVQRLRGDMEFIRYPLSKYFPHDQLKPETLKREKAEAVAETEKAV